MRPPQDPPSDRANGGEGIDARVAELRSKDGLVRERARLALVRTGKPAVTQLVNLLQERDEHVRWEACKALGSINAKEAAYPLVGALADESMEVRWLAAEGLIALGRSALVPVLQALVTNFDSLFLRQGAHHVLHALEREKLVKGKVLAVLDTLRGLGPRSAVAGAARDALESIRKTRAS